MTDIEQVSARQRAIQCREDGGNLYDCAIAAGVTEDTLRNWRKDDLAFSADLEAALMRFKISLIKETKTRKPDVILERRWKEEYGPILKDDKPNITNNILVMGDDSLVKYLYGFVNKLTGPAVPENTPTSATDAASGEGDVISENSVR